MSNLYGVNATYVRNSPPSKVPAGEVNGRLRVAYDQYTLLADTATTDTIYLQKIPAGARVHQVVVVADDLDASGGTLDCGWAASAGGVHVADPNGFLNAVDITTSGGTSTLMTGNLPNGAGQFKQFTEEVQVTVVPSADWDATSGTIKVAVYYTMD